MSNIIKIFLTTIIIIFIFGIFLLKALYDDMKLFNGRIFLLKNGIELTIRYNKHLNDVFSNFAVNNEIAKKYATVEDEQQQIEEGYTYINKSIFTNGEKIEFQVNAKGQTYEIIGCEGEKTIDDITYKTRRRVIYNSESKNQKCHEYVYYEDYLSDDDSATFISGSSILNTFAVVKSNGQVVASGKTSWESAGTKEFNDITGDF